MCATHCTAGARGSFKVHRTSHTMIAYKNLQSIAHYRAHKSVCFKPKTAQALGRMGVAPVPSLSQDPLPNRRAMARRWLD
ncbi:hypothetical protein XFF6990_230037 [Xanthomonas citri pv. fuscans]|nr:hypothetical protein XFF6990_230037 [Xanthomonas citri pv. fuscans]